MELVTIGGQNETVLCVSLMGEKDEAHLINPLHRVSQPDDPALLDMGVCAASPIGPHGVLEPGQRLVHLLTRLRLAADLEQSLTDAKVTATSSREGDSFHQEVGSTGLWVELAPRLGRHSSPNLPLDDCDLAPPPLVGVPFDPPVRDQGGRARRIHRAAMRPFDPDPLQYARFAQAVTSAR